MRADATGLPAPLGTVTPHIVSKGRAAQPSPTVLMSAAERASILIVAPSVVAVAAVAAVVPAVPVVPPFESRPPPTADRADRDAGGAYHTHQLMGQLFSLDGK